VPIRVVDVASPVTRSRWDRAARSRAPRGLRIWLASSAVPPWRSLLPRWQISDTVGHKSTHVTETVYRHVIVPEIRGGATVMDDVFDDNDDAQP